VQQESQKRYGNSLLSYLFLCHSGNQALHEITSASFARSFLKLLIIKLLVPSCRFHVVPFSSLLLWEYVPDEPKLDFASHMSLLVDRQAHQSKRLRESCPLKKKTVKIFL